MKAVAIILAAGEARKMPFHKALIEHEAGKSFLQSLVSTFNKANCRVMGVLGKDSEAVREQHPGVDFVEAERWRDGPLSSMKAGLDAALEDGADMVLLHPVDMPAVRASTLKTLMKQASESSDEVLRPEFDGAPGWPVILKPSAVTKLREAEGQQLDVAMKDMKVRRVTTKDPGVVVNINDPATYERLFGTAPKLAPPPKRRQPSKRGSSSSSTTVGDLGGGTPMAAASED